MSLIADLEASLSFARTIKKLRVTNESQRALIGALREEVELLKAQLAWAHARLLKESKRNKAEVIDLNAIRQSI